MQHSTKNKLWTDETGLEVPFKYVSKHDKLKERSANQLLKKATDINKRLSEFKALTEHVSNKIFNDFMSDKDINKKSKGNYTWFNFDRSIKVEISISDMIQFDDLGIAACKEKLDDFLNEKLGKQDEFIRQMIMDAFHTTRGKLDAKKVLGLLKYKAKISNPIFTQAMTFLEDSIRKTKTKTYFRIWHKDQDGAYRNIDLNFSSIKIKR